MTAPVGLIMPWWGKPPAWLPQFFERAAATKRIEIILFGDAAGFVPQKDIKRFPVTMDQFEARAGECAGFPVTKRSTLYPRGQSLCELRPMLADMYPGILAPYQWWGWGEFDCVWGDWDSFLTDEFLAEYDMIGSNSYMVTGPLTIFRNTPEIANLYRKRLDLLAIPNYAGLDEPEMDKVVRSEASAGRMRALYAGVEAHDRLERWNRCILRDGKLYQMDAHGVIDKEIMLFHFPGKNQWPLAD